MKMPKPKTTKSSGSKAGFRSPFKQAAVSRATSSGRSYSRGGRGR